MEKNRSLEAVLGQLERAELKAAKESRKRMDVERMLKRLDSSFENLVKSTHAPPSPQHDKQQQPAIYRSQQQQSGAHLSSSLSDRAEKAKGATLGIQEKMGERGW